MKRIVLTSLLVGSFFLHGADYAIVGGQDQGNTSYYSVLVAQDGTTTPLTGSIPVGNSIIYSVSMNVSGIAVIGGSHMGSVVPYAALISPTAVATALSGAHPLPAFGEISAVAINDSGAGIIGGHDFGNPYIAYFTSATSLEALTGAALPMGPGQILSAAINNSGFGVIGGQDSGSAYGALVSPSRSTTALSGSTPSGIGQIVRVAINSAGTAIIGGFHQLVMGTPTAYAGLVDSMGFVTPLSGGALPIGPGLINSVSINDSGSAIIGGWHMNQMNKVPYAALVSSVGSTTALTGDLIVLGEITSVAINDSGKAIIGGINESTSTAYAAFVSGPNIATALQGEMPGVGSGIYSVAINDAGAAIIGGYQDIMGSTSPFAAIVSPSGIATELKGPALYSGVGELYSVSIDGLVESVLNAIVPKSYGPGSCYANALFDLSAKIFPTHYMTHHRKFWQRRPLQEEEEIEDLWGLVADAGDVIRYKLPCAEPSDFCLWFAAFGDGVAQKKEKTIPELKNWIAGCIAALDYEGVENLFLGGGAAYTFNYVHLSDSLGHSKFNQEYLTVYASLNTDRFFFNAALWGGLYQMDHVRHSILEITSTSNVNGWLFLPHLEIGAPMQINSGWFTVDPFVMADFANNWQGKVREKGASGFNLEMDSEYTSILRSELGIRFFETLKYSWGHLLIQQKGSYVNKTPFHTGAINAVFVGSLSGFAVEVFNSKTQNLAAVQLNIEFIPCKPKVPYFSLNYQGEFSSFYKSNLLSFEIGSYF